MFEYTSYKDVDLKGKKVLMRVDINSNIDVENKKLRGSSPRIQAIIPSLEELKDSAVVVMAHQSRPGRKDFTSLEMHANKIKELLDRPVKYVEDIFGDDSVQAIKDLKVGEVLVLDNVRKWDTELTLFDDFSKAQQTEMIQTLAPLFDYFIAEAFGAAHRAQPSIIGWPTLVAGPIVEKEFEYMSKILENPQRPMAMLIGGAKAIDKFQAMQYNLDNDRIDYALCAGLTAVLILEGIGTDTGEPNRNAIKDDLEGAEDEIEEIYNKYKDKILLPKDLIIEENGERKAIGIEKLGEYNAVTGDIGDETMEAFKDIIMKCKTIIANGPPGIFEKEVFRKGTFKMAEIMARATKVNDALSVIGGGEMGTAATMAGYDDDVSFISTGGGAMLEILSGKDVPLVKALREKQPK
ncbi:MAG: phosphoglycerate kinase [Promethearchaeia archaeon]